MPKHRPFISFTVRMLGQGGNRERVLASSTFPAAYVTHFDALWLLAREWDGPGRPARSIFDWSLALHQYWMTDIDINPDDVPDFALRQYTLSHICDNATCINPSHVISEAWYDNMARGPCHNLCAQENGALQVGVPCVHKFKCLGFAAPRDEGNQMLQLPSPRVAVVAAPYDDEAIRASTGLQVGPGEADDEEDEEGQQEADAEDGGLEGDEAGGDEEQGEQDRGRFGTCGCVFFFHPQTIPLLHLPSQKSVSNATTSPGT
jgi:hypothetical protein